MLPILGILVLFILNRSKNVGLDEQEEKRKEEILLNLTYDRNSLLTRLATGHYDKNIPSKIFTTDSYDGIKWMIELYDNSIEIIKKEIKKEIKL